MGAHPIVHVEIPASDPAAAGEFYNALFGWGITKDDALNYVMFDGSGGPGGGFPGTEMGTFKVGVPVVYVQTDDIDATLAKAESLGGKIIQPKMEIPGAGWFGLFTDLSGTVMGLYSYPAAG